MKALQSRSWTSYMFVVPYGLSFLTFIVTPIVAAMFLGFMQFDLTSRHSASFVGMRNFSEAIGDPRFRQAATVTCTFAVMMVPLLVVLGLAFAMGLQSMRKGRNTVRGLIFLPGLFNVVVAALIWRWFYDGEFGYFNYLLKHFGLRPIHWLSEKSLAMPSIVGMSLWWSLGGATIILLAAIQQVPSQLFEAAMLDGATAFRIFSRITLPQIRPVLMFVTITSTIGAFQVFGQPFLLTQGGPELSTRAVVQYVYETGFNSYRLGYAAAMSWILFAMIMAFVVLQVLMLRRSTD